MKFGTFCSGIGAPEVAWGRLGWTPVFFSEIKPFPSAVLETHWPNVPNLGDMNFAHEKKQFRKSTVDLICAGTPCQSFSLAGLRAGMADPRGNLALQFLRLLDAKRPRWMVWENVPGVLSSWSDAPDCPTVDGIGPEHGAIIEQTNDFETFIAGLVAIGYGVAWRILDAQGFGVPQRRQRVFVVGHYGSWQRAAAVLLDSDSLSRHPTQGRQAGQVFTAGALRSTDGGSDVDHAAANHIVRTMTAKWAKGTGGPSGDECQNLVVGALSGQVKGGVGNESESLVYSLTGDVAHTLTGVGHDASEGGSGRGVPIVFNMRGREGGNMPEVQADGLASLRAASGGSTNSFVAFNHKASDGQSMNPGPIAPTLDVGKKDGLVVFDMRNGLESDEVTTTILAGAPGHGWSSNTLPHTKTPAGVRRLTPMECERLQGFPDGHTDIIYRKKPAKDSPRYEALGNSMAVPVLFWLGQRIQMVEDLCNKV